MFSSSTKKTKNTFELLAVNVCSLIKGRDREKKGNVNK